MCVSACVCVFVCVCVCVYVLRYTLGMYWAGYRSGRVAGGNSVKVLEPLTTA